MRCKRPAAVTFRIVTACWLVLMLGGCERSTPAMVGADAAQSAQAMGDAAAPVPCDDWRGDGIIGPGGMLRSSRFRLCPAGFTCELPAGACGGPGSVSGVCVARPASCPATRAPVCGCNHHTYDNDCQRTAAGVALAEAGVCPAAAINELCGGPAHIPCAANLFCNTGWGDCQRVAAPDAQGSCEPRSESCVPDRHLVCGCDGKTYEDDCQRAAAGVVRRQYGRCDVDCNAVALRAFAVIDKAVASVDPQCVVDADCKALGVPGSCLDCVHLAGNAQVAAAIAARASDVEAICREFADAGCVVIPSGCPGIAGYRCEQRRCVAR
jgi:hypothetical protein